MKTVDEESLERKTLLEKPNTNSNIPNNGMKFEERNNVKNDNDFQNEGDLISFITLFSISFNI